MESKPAKRATETCTPLASFTNRFSISPFPIYHSISMAKRQVQSRQKTAGRSKSGSAKHVTREYVHSLRGKFRGKALLKELMAEKRRESNL